MSKHMMDNYNDKINEKGANCSWEINEVTPREKRIKGWWCCPTHKLDIKIIIKKPYFKREKPKKGTFWIRVLRDMILNE